MKDFCGRSLKHNDLVVSKPSGRNAKMEYGLIREELNTVWFRPYSHGGSDIVLIETDSNTRLNNIRLKLIDAREADIIHRAKKKEDKKNRKLKKSQLKRFGVYQGDSICDREIFLGKCNINGKEVENVWMELSSKDTANMIEFWGYTYYINKHSTPKYRTVKYPQKFIEEIVFTEDDMRKLQKESMERLKEKCYKTDSFIEIIF